VQPTIVVTNELVQINLSIDQLAAFILKLRSEDVALVDANVLCSCLEARHFEFSICINEKGGL
jgi:hypothetical protein